MSDNKLNKEENWDIYLLGMTAMTTTPADFRLIGEKVKRRSQDERTASEVLVPRDLALHPAPDTFRESNFVALLSQ